MTLELGFEGRAILKLERGRGEGRRREGQREGRRERESGREYEHKSKSAGEYISTYFHGLRKSIEESRCHFLIKRVFSLAGVPGSSARQD